MADHAGALRIAELMAARLCHDLAGPIGTVNQALELITGDDEALALAREAAADLAQRLKLRRAAWTPNEQGLNLNTLRELATEAIRVDLIGLPADTVFPPPLARVLLNVLLLAQSSLPEGGRIALHGDPTDVFVTIAGPNAAWPPGLALYLVDADAAMAALSDPRTLQAPLTALLAFGLGVRLSMLFGAGNSSPPPLRMSIS